MGIKHSEENEEAIEKICNTDFTGREKGLALGQTEQGTLNIRISHSFMEQRLGGEMSAEQRNEQLIPEVAMRGASIHDIQTKMSELSSRDENGEEKTHEEHKIHAKVPNHYKILSSLLAGAVAGAVAKTLIAPLDRTKINFQISNKQFSYRKAIEFLINTYKKEGFTKLYRGNSATMARIIPYAAIQYAAHEQYKRFLMGDTQKQHLPPVKRFLAGSFAGLTSSFLTYPLDLVRARMAVTLRSQYNNMPSVFRETLKQEGFFTLYRGIMPTLVGSFFYSGASFFVYETLKKWHAETCNGRDPYPVERLLCGAIAGLCGQSLTYPLDIVRRRMQTAGCTGHTYDYKTTYRTLILVWRQEGVKGLYKGLSMNVIKGPIAVGTSFTVYDISLHFMRRFWIKDEDDG